MKTKIYALIVLLYISLGTNVALATVLDSPNTIEDFFDYDNVFLVSVTDVVHEGNDTSMEIYSNNFKVEHVYKGATNISCLVTYKYLPTATPKLPMPGGGVASAGDSVFFEKGDLVLVMTSKNDQDQVSINNVMCSNVPTQIWRNVDPLAKVMLNMIRFGPLLAISGAFVLLLFFLVKKMQKKKMQN